MHELGNRVYVVIECVCEGVGVWCMVGGGFMMGLVDGNMVFFWWVGGCMHACMGACMHVCKRREGLLGLFKEMVV